MFVPIATDAFFGKDTFYANIFTFFVHFYLFFQHYNNSELGFGVFSSNTKQIRYKT